MLGWLAVVLAGLGWLVVGCDRRETAVASGNREQILHLSNQAEPGDLDPQTISGNLESNLVPSLIEGLVTLDMRTLAVRPGAAASWEVSPDRLTYTFHLQPDGRWSNGDPVTALDFVRAYRRMLTPALGSSYAYMLFCVTGAEDYAKGRHAEFSRVGFRALDERTLQISLAHPTPFFLPMLVHHSWFPVHLPTVERYGGLTRQHSAWTRPEHYVGNGAFRLKSWRPDQLITLEASPTYWDRAHVRLREVRFHSVDSIETQERMFRAGQLHRTDTVLPTKIDAYRRERPGVLSLTPYYGTFFLRLNVNKPPLDDARVRRSLALAIDRERLVRNVLRGGQQPAWHFTPPGPAGFAPQARYGFDPAEARRLLAEAGYPEGRGFPLIECSFNTHDFNRLVLEAIQEMWHQHLGLRVRLVNSELKVFLASLGTGDYTIARSTWYGDYLDPQNFLELWVTGGGNNNTGWGRPDYDRLLVETLTARDEIRLGLFQRMEDVLAEEMPVIPVFFPTQVRLVSPALKGWYPNSLGYHYYKDCWLEMDTL
jgi:oligopeptide transport system substrate-binding protein